jgi:hypothetical protein
MPPPGQNICADICLPRYVLDPESESTELHSPAAQFLDSVLLKVVVIRRWIKNLNPASFEALALCIVT